MSVIARTYSVAVVTVICTILGGPVGTAAQDTTGTVEPATVVADDSLDIEHLALTIDATSLTDETFTGSARYRLRVNHEAPLRLQLWAADLDVQHIQLGRTDTTVSVATFRQPSGDSLIIELEQVPSDTTFELTINYQGAPNPGLQIQTGTDGSLDAVWTTGTPTTNRFWFPTWERLTDTFTSELKVTIPGPLQLVAGGRRLSTSEDTDDAVTSHYAFDQPHPSHLIGFAAGRYESVRTSVQQANGESVILEYLVPPERIGDTRRTFGATPEIIKFLADRLEVPYPWPLYRQAVVPGVRPAGMQPPMTAIVSDSLVIDQRASQDFPPDEAIAQSTASQWIGSLVRPASWSDAWIVQGLSTYLAVTFIEHRFGNDEALLTTNKLQREYLEAIPHPSIPLSPKSWNSPVDMLTSAQQAKAAWVFRMLHHRLGDELFYAALRQLITDHRTDAVTTADLQNTFEEMSGESLKVFFDQWVFSPGHPVLQISYGHNPSIDSLSIHVEQHQQEIQVPEAFQLDLPITAYGLMDHRETELNVRRQNQIISVGLRGEPRFVEIDPSNIVLDSTRYEQPAAAWVRQLNEGQTVVSRLQAAREVRKYAGDPSLPIGLRGALRGASPPAVRAAVIRTMGALPTSETINNTIVEAANSESSLVRRAALAALRESEDVPRAREVALQAAQRDTSYTVQAAAIRTLAYLGGDNAFRVVQSAFVTSSHNNVIRRAAFDALAIIDEPLSRELPLALKWSEPGVSPFVRAAAAGYLADHLDNSRARRRAADLLADPDIRVRKAAVDALTRRADAQSTRLLEQRLEEEKHPWVRHALRAALKENSAAP